MHRSITCLIELRLSWWLNEGAMPVAAVPGRHTVRGLKASPDECQWLANVRNDTKNEFFVHRRLRMRIGKLQDPVTNLAQ